ncbi:YaiI/YqxD family protein [soil metagenome]
MTTIYIDADACPVKQEVYRVAERFGLKVILVANKRMFVPDADWISFELVDGKFDAADDWIADHVIANDVVVTSDIPLAGRCLKKDAAVIAPGRKIYTKANIGEAMASRELMSRLRDSGDISGGPAPFEKSDRSWFLHQLDQILRGMN